MAYIVMAYAGAEGSARYGRRRILLCAGSGLKRNRRFGRASIFGNFSAHADRDRRGARSSLRVAPERSRVRRVFGYPQHRHMPSVFAVGMPPRHSKKNACAAQTGLLALALLLGCDFADGLDGAGGKKATDAAITNMP